MKNLQSMKFTVLASTLVLSGLLVGCQDSGREETTVGQALDRSVQETKEVVDKTGDAIEEKAVNVAESAKETAGRVTTSLEDVTITASVQASFLKDPDLSILKIDVDTRDGVVELSGRVASASVKDRATQIAQAIEGVKSVTNDLVVEGS